MKCTHESFYLNIAYQSGYLVTDVARNISFRSTLCECHQVGIKNTGTQPIVALQTSKNVLSLVTHKSEVIVLAGAAGVVDSRIGHASAQHQTAGSQREIRTGIQRNMRVEVVARSFNIGVVVGDV